MGIQEELKFTGLVSLVSFLFSLSVSLGCFVVVVVFRYFFLSFDGGNEGRVSDEEARRFT